MTKTLEQNFVDWEGVVFGFGYGSGEEHILPALKKFFDAFGVDDRPLSYDFRRMEDAVSPPVAWFLINALCHADIIEYGTSPRYGWLTPHGAALKSFVDSKSADDLVEICTKFDEGYVHCYPDACNCGTGGYEAGKVCENPFWKARPPAC